MRQEAAKRPAPGEVVRLRRLEPEFFDGLDPDDVLRLKGLIGKEWTVDGIEPQTGFIELIFAHADGASTPFDWVTIPLDWIERQAS